MRWLSVTACVALGAACADAAGPRTTLHRCRSGDQSGPGDRGREQSAGKLHLQQARDQLDAAKKLSKDKPEVAARKLDNAQAEAELAKSITREQTTRAEADEAKARLLSAQKNLKGTGGGQ